MKVEGKGRNPPAPRASGGTVWRAGNPGRRDRTRCGCVPGGPFPRTGD